MLINFKEQCSDPRCKSWVRAGHLHSHVHYFDRDHENDPIKPEEAHRISPKKRGDSCRCGGMNPSCPHCGGNGIIP